MAQILDRADDTYRQYNQQIVRRDGLWMSALFNIMTPLHCVKYSIWLIEIIFC